MQGDFIYMLTYFGTLVEGGGGGWGGGGWFGRRATGV